MDYSEAVKFLQSFPDMERGTHGARGATMSLDSMRSLLRRMGDPQNGRHTVHVTGSKGKGSTSTVIASILKAAGYTTALYTSPHLHSYRERIAFDLTAVSEEAFAKGLAEIQPFVQAEQDSGSTVSTFGVVTALFFHLTKQSESLWQVVEVGMGGRFDATNVFESKEASVITAISLEHIEILGTNHSEIASNKAGIITPGCAVILAPQTDPSVRSVIGRRASEMHADLIYVPKTYKIKPQSHDKSGQNFDVDGPDCALHLHTPLLGVHQVYNASTAVATAKALVKRGFAISDDSIIRGVELARIPGRFELIESDYAPPVVLDGAHNDESAASLAAGLKALFADRRCIFVLGVNKDKNVNAIWRELLPLSRMIITTQSSNPRAMDAHALAEQLSFQTSLTHLEAKVTKSVAEGLEAARLAAGKDDVICITGSLYVVAEAREHLQCAHQA